MKLVAMSQGVTVYPDRNERRDTLDQRLSALLSSTGYVPVPVPNSLILATTVHSSVMDPVTAWMIKVNARAVVLSGGNDIGTCQERDLTESRLLDYAKTNELPALGICRGMQMMAVWSGIKLNPVTGHVRTRHCLRGEVSSDVNSFHNLALSDCPPNFVVIARSEDGSIEAIRHTSLPWEGWMWHPEREETFAEHDVRRLKMLFGE
jgi:N5-(cytidine 5'-diphosphoramidyl)-L-glutamine hydrolase